MKRSLRLVCKHVDSRLVQCEPNSGCLSSLCGGGCDGVYYPSTTHKASGICTECKLYFTGTGLSSHDALVFCSRYRQWQPSGPLDLATLTRFNSKAAYDAYVASKFDSHRETASELTRAMFPTRSVHPRDDQSGYIPIGIELDLLPPPVKPLPLKLKSRGTPSSRVNMSRAPLPLKQRPLHEAYRGRAPRPSAPQQSRPRVVTVAPLPLSQRPLHRNYGQPQLPQTTYRADRRNYSS